MIESVMLSHPVSAMPETTKVETSSMFVTSLEKNLYGGLSVSPSYQSFSTTFYGIESIPWTSPMSSTYGIPYGTSLTSSTQSSLPPLSTPTLQQHDGSHVSWYGHLQQPHSPLIGDPLHGGKFPS